MTYETIFARSFSRHEQRKLGCAAFVGCFIIAFTICTVFKPYLGPLPVLNLQLSVRAGLNMLMITKKTNEPQESYFEIKEVKPICNLTQPRSDVCQAIGDIRTHGNSSTILIAATHRDIFEGKSYWHVKPYARKEDNIAMSRVRTITMRRAQITEGIPECSRNFSIPAIVFSIGGYAGNHFHDFTDVLIPLYLTSKEFDGEVQFLLTDKHSWWTTKYRALLGKLSQYELIDFDNENEVLCFPRVIVGLKANKEFSIDSSKSSYSMMDFTKFLRNTYSLKRDNAKYLRNNHDSEGKRPRLLIVSRRKTRRLMNEQETAEMARSIGFDVVIKVTGSNLTLIAPFVNSFDLLMGVHGAGLSNMVFLPQNAVIIQIIPLGEMERLARTDFEAPAKDMNLWYLDYKISPNESSLIQQYSSDHEILKDPGAIYKKGWRSYRSIYLDKQDVKLDLIRFRHILAKAYEFLQR